MKKYIYKIDRNLINLSDIQTREMVQSIEDYVKNLYEKLRLTKNIIFRNMPIDFRKAYVPLTLKIDNYRIKLDNPQNFFQDYPKATIVGTAGSGKSTLLRHLFLNCFENDYKIPIYLELRKINSIETNLEKAISNEISEKYSSVICQLFSSGSFVFIFDGFDEIDFSFSNKIIRELEAFVTKNQKNDFIISTRPGTGVEYLSHFYNFEIEPLNRNDIMLFVEKLAIPKEIRIQIYKAIDKKTVISQSLQNPLFLSLYVLSAYTTGEIPDRKTIFFRSVLDSLFSKHDSISKLGYLRNKMTGLSSGDLQDISSIIAFLSFFGSKYQYTKDELFKEFDKIKSSKGYDFDNERLLYDLVLTINILVVDGNYYQFQHIFLVEYLAALFISKLNISSKESFYNKIATSESIYLSLSFMDIIGELDLLSFNKFYLIPKLAQILKNDNNEYLKNQEELYERILFTYVRNSLSFKRMMNNFRRNNPDINFEISFDLDLLRKYLSFLQYEVAKYEHDNDFLDII